MPGIFSNKITNRKVGKKSGLPSSIGYRASIRKRVCNCEVLKDIEIDQEIGTDQYDAVDFNHVTKTTSIIGSSDKNIGHSVSLNNDGTYMAVSGIGEYVENPSKRITKVYEKYNNSWQQKGGDIVSSTNDMYPYRTILSDDGTILIISDPGYNSKRGRIEFYKYNDSDYSFVTNIDGSDENDLLGYAIALSQSNNNFLIVNTSINDGIHIMYDISDINNITERKTFTADDSISSVAINGNNVTIGYPHLNKVIIYDTDPGNNTKFTITNSDGAKFGMDVTLSKDGLYLCVGDYKYNSNSGRVTVYNYGETATWEKVYEIDGDDTNDYLARCSISNGGNYILVGTMQQLETSYERPGYIKIYEKDNDTFKLLETLEGYLNDVVIEGSQLSLRDGFGDSLSISSDGTTIVAGIKYYKGFVSTGYLNIYQVKL